MVVFRGHEHYIVGNASDADAANVQGLCLYVAVEVVSEQLAELGGIDVFWRQYGLVRIETRARIVVVIGKHSQKTASACGCRSRVVLDSNAVRTRCGWDRTLASRKCNVGACDDAEKQHQRNEFRFGR